MTENMFCCPNCGAALSREGNSLICAGAKRHCFDIAAQGYVNLAPPRAAGGGDDATLIDARRAFLARGHYRPIAARVVELLDRYAKGRRVLDAGCGEGYYTEQIAQAGYRTAGVDLSRRGVRAAARSAQKNGTDVSFAVAGIFDLPIGDGTLDAVVSLFAPIAEQEFSRVLKEGGILITVEAGEAHLQELKAVLYDDPRKNEVRADAPVQMPRLCGETLSFSMELSGQEARELFAMTPYYYRTPKEGLARLAELAALSCRAEVRIGVYEKRTKHEADDIDPVL